MTEHELQRLKDWFDQYTASFYSENEEDQRNIMLKIEHTYNVCRNMKTIAEGASLDENRLRIAEAVALLHDLGRFPQYTEFKTFRDAESVSHGLLGAKTLVREKALEHLPAEEQALIIQTVKFHSAFSIPTTLNEEGVLFLKLVRDADKIDIFRVFIDYFESPKDERASATAFGMPDSPECSPAMLSSIAAGQVASYTNIRTENDFKLMQLSWVYDMNFQESVRLLFNRGYIDRIIDKLPQTDEVRRALKHLTHYLDRRLSNERRT